MDGISHMISKFYKISHSNPLVRNFLKLSSFNISSNILLKDKDPLGLYVNFFFLNEYDK